MRGRNEASTIPLSIGTASGASALSSAQHLPAPLRELVQLRTQADAALHAPALRRELADGTAGPNAAQARDSLVAVVHAAEGWQAKCKSSGKVSAEDDARGEYCLAFALSRIGEFDGTSPADLPARLEDSLAHFQRAADLLALPQPPEIEAVPSVTRPQDPKRQGGAVDLPPVSAWVAEMLAEWARAQTTLAFSSVMAQGDGHAVVQEDRLASLLDLACRRNVQALFTPIDPLTPPEEATSASANTVMGNARLIRDLSSLLPFSRQPTHWSRRLAWATHVADVRFVAASMSANKLVDAASAHAQVLQNSKISPAERREVKRVVEKTLRRIAPFERTQGNVLLWLGRVMLDAVGALYLGRSEGFQEERRRRDDSSDTFGAEDEDQEQDGQKTEVPENDLVRETRQVLIRAAALFENAYASILRSPRSSRRKRLELRLLRRLEATYCDLENLDNSTPEVVELRSQRIERAVFINDRLVALGDTGGDDEMAESDHEEADEEKAEEEADEDSDEEEERLARQFGRQRIV
ncbi:uncharacterized protein JCM10292_000659 [Rhodotorula paludigena]|uniref:uncharacterized protein n=1 Tax=Rhodotorula paludigena TaxID=86838 RepID=UPI0031818EF3